MKRRQSGGEYEANWQEIPAKYITQYGIIQYEIDDVRPDYYQPGNFDFELTNYDGYFGPEDDDKSFFYGYLTRYKTLVKVEAGYEADDGTEYPTTSSLFVGFLDWDMMYDDSGKVKFSAKNLISIFEDLPSDRIAGLGTTQTAKQIFEKIRDYQDGNSVYVFQKYITSGAWNITSTVNTYDMSTSTTLQGSTCLDLMKKIAGAENHIFYVNGIGDFYFRQKSDITSTVAFHFSGVGDTDKTWGHNIQKISVDENIRKVYNRVRIKHDSEDTTTSYYIRNETWNWGDSSSSFKFGVKEYLYDNTFLNTTMAITIGDLIYNEYVNPKDEIKITAKFVPGLMVQDRATVTYKKQRYLGDDLWGYFLWGYGIWGTRLGYNILLDNQSCRVTKVAHNIDNFTTDVVLREI